MRESGMNGAIHDNRAGTPQPIPPAGFDPDSATEFVNVSTEKFTQVPKASHRDGDHKVASILGIGVLTLYLSNKTGWKIPNAEQLAKQYKEGAARIRDALSDLEAAGWLVRFPMQVKGGTWRTFTFVSNDPEQLEDHRRYKSELEAERVQAGKPGTSSKSPRPPRAKKKTGGDRSVFPQVTPDGTKPDPVDRDPVDGDPVDRDPVDRNPVQRDLKDQENREENKENKKPSPLPPVEGASPDSPPDSGGGFSDNKGLPPRLSALDDLVERLVAIAPSWDRAKTREVLIALREGGKSPEEISRVAVEVASGVHGETRFPGRLLAWWPLPKPVVQEPSWAKGPVAYVEPGTTMCRKHRGEPQLGCGKCKTESFLDGADLQVQELRAATPEPDHGLTGLELARANAAAAKTGSTVRQRRPEQLPMASTQEPTQLAEVLTDVAQKIGSRS